MTYDGWLEIQIRQAADNLHSWYETDNVHDKELTKKFAFMLVISSSCPCVICNFYVHVCTIQSTESEFFKLFRSLEIDSTESIPPAYVACAGNLTIYVGLEPSRVVVPVRQAT